MKGKENSAPRNRFERLCLLHRAFALRIHLQSVNKYSTFGSRRLANQKWQRNNSVQTLQSHHSALLRPAVKNTEGRLRPQGWISRDSSETAEERSKARAYLVTTFTGEASNPSVPMATSNSNQQVVTEIGN